MWFSRRRRSFSRIRFWSGPVGDASSENAFTHLFSVDSPIPRSAGTCQRVRPLVSAIRATSLLNSSLCLCAMSDLLDGKYRSQVTGTKLGQIQIALGMAMPRASSGVSLGSVSGIASCAARFARHPPDLA
jgi:hypothetical protein